MLELSQLHVAYGPIPAVRGIDLEVGRGEAVALLGRNGAGKTTTLKAAAGLLRPTRGRVLVDGRDMTRQPAHERVQCGVALVPEGRGIFPGLTTRENLAMGGYRRPLGLRALEGEIERVTERLPLLRARLGQRAGSLSGGEQQMLAIARALMGSPRVLLVDELSLGLAPIVVETLYEVLEELRAEEMAVLVVEQYATLALRFADRAYVLEKGQVVLAGIAAELAASPQLLDAYLSSTPVEVS